MIRPVAQRWGGGPLSKAERWRGQLGAQHGPSTILRMVPLPTSFARREELL